MIATIGLARIAPPVAMAAETPQIEMPDARGAAHSFTEKLGRTYKRCPITYYRPVSLSVIAVKSFNPCGSTATEQHSQTVFGFMLPKFDKAWIIEH